MVDDAPRSMRPGLDPPKSALRGKLGGVIQWLQLAQTVKGRSVRNWRLRFSSPPLVWNGKTRWQNSS